VEQAGAGGLGGPCGRRMERRPVRRPHPASAEARRAEARPRAVAVGRRHPRSPIRPQGRRSRAPLRARAGGRGCPSRPEAGRRDRQHLSRARAALPPVSILGGPSASSPTQSWRRFWPRPVSRCRRRFRMGRGPMPCTAARAGPAPDARPLSPRLGRGMPTAGPIGAPTASRPQSAGEQGGLPLPPGGNRAP
jgi:hypothetical protein